MSDLPPPPPSVSPPPPPPPPPPPDLAAPPGYAGYSATPFTQASLKRVSGLAKIAMTLVLATALMSFVELLVRQTVTDEAENYLAGSIDKDEFQDAIVGYSIVPVVASLFQVAALVITIIWMFRVAANHRALHRGGTWGPGWAIAGWVLPPFIYVIPTLMLVELWKASDPDVPIGGNWRAKPAAPLPVIWGVVYTAASVLSLAANATGDISFSGTDRALAEQLTSDQSLEIVVSCLNIAAAVVFVVLVRRLTQRHTRLTGEVAR
jgi:Domain of unknown function (DUF4328)